jgi:hypothetical protein
MEQVNFLQKRIKERAESRFNRDLSSLVESISKNAIGNLLAIDGNAFVNEYGSITNTFFNRNSITELGVSKTNIEKIKGILIEKYIKEETDDILSKLGVLSDFLGNERI